jgi:hypothetical protein
VYKVLILIIHFIIGKLKVKIYSTGCEFWPNDQFSGGNI